MKFIVSFGKTNTFSLDVAPVTNRDYVFNRLATGFQPSEVDVERANLYPDAPHHNATFEKAKSFCDGGTVVFA